jgi:hypothetical protein
MQAPKMSRKKLGEWAEMAFMLRATALGFTVSKPFGDTAQYDFLVEKQRRVSRIQVKCTAALLLDAYRVQTRHRAGRNVRYNLGHADFIACYVIPEDAWYIIPVEAISHTTAIYLRPHRPKTRARHEIFRDAWHLLEPEPELCVAQPPPAVSLLCHPERSEESPWPPRRFVTPSRRRS